MTDDPARRPPAQTAGSLTTPDGSVYPPQFASRDLAASPRTLIDLLIATATAHPEAPAIDDGTVVLRYREVLDVIRDRALELARAGVGPGDRVGVRVSSGSTDLYTAILGVLMVGAAYVPVDVDDPDERARTVFEEADVQAVVTDGFALEVRHSRTADQQPELRAPGLEDDAWIIFASGSTGKPKGVAVSHRSAAAFVDAEARIFCQGERLGPGGRVLVGLAASGVHSNAFSLVRQIVKESGLTYADRPAELGGQQLGAALLEPTKIYVKAVLPMLKAGQIEGVAPITGGGLPENLPRMFGDDLQAVIDPATWPRLPIFDWLVAAGKLSAADAYATFNMGLGMVLAVKPTDLATVQEALAAAGEESFEIGQLQARPAGGDKLVIKGVSK